MVLQVRHATSADDEFLLWCINEAYRPANVVIKTERSINRCTIADIHRMLSTPNSKLLVAEDVPTPEGAAGESERFGCVYIEWQADDHHAADDDLVVGHMSFLCVPAQFSKRGAGTALVVAGEALLAQHALAQAKQARMDIEVMCIRSDLFEFYRTFGQAAS